MKKLSLAPMNKRFFFRSLFNEKKIFYIPINWKLLYRLLQLLEFLKLNFGFRSDSILSIWGENKQAL